MDDQRRKIPDGGIFVRENVIEAVGPTPELPAEADQVIDAYGMVVMPGLINTHHHLYQTLTRAMPAVQNAELFEWLVYLYPIWAETRFVTFGLLTEARHDRSSPLSQRLSQGIALAARRGQRVVAGGPYPKLSDQLLRNALDLNREASLYGLELVLVSPEPPSPELSRAVRDARARLTHREY